MRHERVILGAGVIMALVGSLVAIQRGQMNWRIVGGSIAFTALLALLSTAGDGPGKIASGMAVVGATSMILFEGADLFTLLSSLGNGTGGSSGIGGGTGRNAPEPTPAPWK